MQILGQTPKVAHETNKSRYILEGSVNQQGLAPGRASPARWGRPRHHTPGARFLGEQYDQNLANVLMSLSLESSATGPDTAGRRAEDRLDVWQASLECGRDILEQLHGCLNAEELARARRFRMPHHQRRWAVARATVRHVLAGYLECPPAQVAFCYGPQGKPALASGGEVGLRFNLSHSHERVLVGVTWNRELGIDLERFRPMKNHQALAERYFSAWEAAALAALPDDQRLPAFFRTWTRKEAYLKARGTGLTERLRNFDVEVRPSEPCRLLATRPQAEECHRWYLIHLDCGTDYVAAAAVEGSPVVVRRFDWRPPTLRAHS